MRCGRVALAAALCAFFLAPAPGFASTLSGSASATVVTPLSFINVAPLNFGAIVPATTAGTVVIDANSGARTKTGAITLAGVGYSRALFDGGTSGFGVVQVTMATTTITLNRVGGGATMNVALDLGDLPGFQIQNQPTNKVSFIGNNTIFQVGVGGTLTVGANQAAGTYTATFNVTANYF